MDLNMMIQKNLIEELQKKGVKVLYDTVDSWGKRFDLEVETQKEAEAYMENHYWENEDMEERKDSLDYKIVAYQNNENTGEKQTIIEISKTVDFEEYVQPDDEMHNRV